MEKQKHIIIFSHGFGVKKDDRGLLTDIAKSFPDSICYLFDYFLFNESESTLTMCSFSEQVKIFSDVVEGAKQKYPDAIIDVISHSQGTLIPPLASLNGIRKTILLAPVFDMSIERTIKRYSEHPETVINLEGESRLPILDGYVRVVPREYWVERKEIKPFDLYNEYTLRTELTVINANQDTILGSPDVSLFSKTIKILSLDGDHGFSGEARNHLIKTIKGIIWT